VSCLIYGSETWPIRSEHGVKKLNETEIDMIRWMCGIILNEVKKVKNLENC